MKFVPENLAQAINPWSWWLNASDNTNALVNINNIKSRNPKLEQKIVTEVAGYGMQLGIIEDMLELMIGFLPKSQLTEQQTKNIERFKKMRADISAHKERDLLEQFSASSVDEFLEKLEKIKASDPELYHAVKNRLKRGLD